MDPTATLRRLREIVTETHERECGDYDDLAIEMAQAVEALDNWICSGGFLPDAWEIARKRAKED